MTKKRQAMTTDQHLEAIKALPANDSKRNSARDQQLVEYMPEILAALARGNNVKTIAQALTKSGIKIAERTLFRHISKYRIANPNTIDPKISKALQALNPKKPNTIKESKTQREATPVNQEKTDRSDPEALKQIMREDVDLAALAKIGKSK